MATINAEEISSILKTKLQNYRESVNISGTGSVLSVGDGIVKLYGLRDAMAGELVEFDNEENTPGLVLNLEENSVGAVVLGDFTKIREGMSVKTTGRIASVPVGDG
ncbi:MAG: F0F1 ATP synthase subunit alpha, partial [Candidatus Gastranaerophilaceae bacterium]